MTELTNQSVGSGKGPAAFAWTRGHVLARSTARSAAAGQSTVTALTAGFHTGFALSAALVAATIVIAAALLREDGRGERVNLVELEAGQ